MRQIKRNEGKGWNYWLDTWNKIYTLSAYLTFRLKYNTQMNRKKERCVPAHISSVWCFASVMLRHSSNSFLHFKYPYTSHRMLFFISPSIQGYRFRYPSHNAPFIRCTAYTISQPRRYKSPDEKFMGSKTKAGNFPEVNAELEQRQAGYGTEPHLECNTLCFHLSRKKNAQNSEADFHPGQSIRGREKGVRSLWLTAVTVQTHSFCQSEKEEVTLSHRHM